MAKWEQKFITDHGARLLSKLQAGIKVEFTEIMIGDGQHLKNGEITASNELINPRTAGEIKSIQVTGPDTVSVVSVFSNQGLQEGFFMREIGLLAKAEDEAEKVLYCLAVAAEESSDYLPSCSGDEVKITFRFHIAVGVASNVTAHIINTYQAYEIGYAKEPTIFTSDNLQGVVEEVSFRLENLESWHLGEHVLSGANVVVGGSLNSNSSGAGNTVMGYNAMIANTEGSQNTAVGHMALLANEEGNRNTALGHYAMSGNTVGSFNTAVGTDDLEKSETASHNTALGAQALQLNDSGRYNTASGAYCMQNNISGGHNTVAGTHALYKCQDSSFNVAMGSNALYEMEAGSSNTAIGMNALREIKNGLGNTAIGNVAGYNASKDYVPLENCNYAVLIGSGVRPKEDKSSNEIVIGYEAVGQGSNTAHIGNSDVTAISYGNGTGTAFRSYSDPRIKEDIEDADTKICYDSIKSLPLHRYRYKNFIGKMEDQHQIGFLSTEFKEVLPKAVKSATQYFEKRDAEGNIIYETKTLEEADPETGEAIQVEKEIPQQICIENCESIDTSQLIPMLVGAMQEMMQEIEALKAQKSLLHRVKSKIQ